MKDPIEQYKKVQSMDTKPIEEPAFEKVTQDNKLRRVAKFILLIGKDQAQEVLSHLGEEEIQQICKELAFIKEIDKAEARDILQEFGVRRESVSSMPVDSFSTARDILQNTLGKEQGDALLKKAQPEKFPSLFSFLDDVELPQLLHLIEDESPIVLSLLLPQLKPEKAAELLKTQSKEIQLQLIQRLGRMEKVDPMVLEKTAEVLKAKLDQQGTWDSQEWDGTEVLANILKHMDVQEEDKLLNGLAKEDEAMVNEVREKLFTMEMIFRLRDGDLYKALATFSDKDIAILLKMKERDVQNKILSAISQRRKEIILSELTIMGPIRKSEVLEKTREFLDFLRKKQEEGEYLFINPLEEYI